MGRKAAGHDEECYHEGLNAGPGSADLNEIFSGLQPSELMILAAHPSQDKTAFALNVSCNAAVRRGMPVGVFSLGMAREQMAQRMLCIEANVNSHGLCTGLLADEEWYRLMEAARRLSEAPVFIDDTPDISVVELCAKARRMKAEFNIGLLVIDYLQLIEVNRRMENSQQAVSEISRSLKALAGELQVPILALSQLSRVVEQRDNFEIAQAQEPKSALPRRAQRAAD